MHNCRKTKEQITELLLDGADRRLDEVLLAELRTCAECRTEFNALNATLRVTTRLREVSAPAESYWIGYHAKLRQKLVSANTLTAQSSNSSRLVRFVRSSVSVPVPVVASLIIVCAIVIPFAIRAARQQTLPPTTSIVRVPVEVPVVQEKTVTRVVYRVRRSPVGQSKRVIEPANNVFAKSQKPQNAEIPASLTGFKPTEDVKLTVIKGGSQNEK